MISQISMSVQQTAEVVALMPPALTMKAVSRVPVYLDITEMDSPVQVTEFKPLWVLYTWKNKHNHYQFSTYTNIFLYPFVCALRQ